MRATQLGDDVRLRSALPALDRPAPQGRPAARALPLADRRRAEPTSRSRGESYSLPHAEGRAGARRPGDAARARPAGGDRPPRAATLRRRCARSTSRSRGCSDADRLRRARQDGRQHGRAHPARLRPRGRRLRLRRKAVDARAEARARRGAHTLERARQGSSSAPRTGVDHGPGRRRDPEDGRRAREAARARTT